MTPLSNLNQEEILSFFAVLVRFSVLVAVLPILGDRFVPGPVKVLFALAVTIALFPALVSSGQIDLNEAQVWGSTTFGIVGTIALEVMFGLALGYTARLLFDSISFGANLMGNFMGFAAASTYDPHQESQTQVVAEIQMTLAMLVFLALDGHHLILRSVLDSYRIVGLGKAGFSMATSQRFIDMTAQVIRFGIQIAAPIAVSLFAVNVGFGVLSKAMPQLNVLVLSFAVSALIGMALLFLGLPEFQGAAVSILGRIEDWMQGVMMAIRQDGAN